MKKIHFQTISILFICALLMSVGYLFYNTYGDVSFALQLRGKKVAAFILVSLAISISTISFQSIVGNQFLTPGILGLDQLYVLIQTVLFFFFGGTVMLMQQSLFMFILNVLAMSALSVLFLLLFVDKMTGNLYLLLMVGIVSGTMFASVSTFLQVIMNPNEYDLLQGKLFASFNNVNSQYLVVAGIIIALCSLWLYLVSRQLDVMLLGSKQALVFGISVYRFQIGILFAVSLLTAVATALVGPTIFLGFIVSTICYRLFPTYRHTTLFIGGFLLSVILLIGGQFLFEQIFHFNTTIGIIIQFVGGVFFLGKIFQERMK